MNSIGAYELADSGINDLYYDPQRPGHFKFTCPDVEGMERLELAIDASSIPFMSQDKLTIRRGATEINFAGSMHFQDQSLRVIDYIGLDDVDVLLGWQKLSGDVDTQKVGLARDYKKTGFLTLYDPNFNPVRTWTLKGCWISGLSEDELDMQKGASDKMNINCTITYDMASYNKGTGASKGR